MTEPTSLTGAAAIATGLGLAALLPGIDGDALIGAFAGGTLFVVSAKDFSLWKRSVYLIVSVIAGYYGADDVSRWVPLRSTGMAAFICAACSITVTLALIERGRDIHPPRFPRGGPPSA
ncbi:hypothetical protein D7Y39_05170 [Stenotrophomonas maltophilia]|uniref:putative holin n=1 Tax=Stenotrophomonas maltophilia TaxID=40324 RepID=UPI0015DF49A1|nr:putative holin [Stenotrophomonas maltophilia]MBA0289224.1 hypothetical protein [Stenotrophomonas maltophilia]